MMLDINFQNGLEPVIIHQILIGLKAIQEAKFWIIVRVKETNNMKPFPVQCCSHLWAKEM